MIFILSAFKVRKFSFGKQKVSQLEQQTLFKLQLMKIVENLQHILFEFYVRPFMTNEIFREELTTKQIILA